MKVLSPTTHGVIDYLLCATMALLPSLMELHPTTVVLLYTLSVTYFLVTLCTAFPPGVVRVLPFKAHGVIEVLALLGMMASPWLFGFADHQQSMVTMVVLGLGTAAVAALTDWTESEPEFMPRPPRTASHH